MKSIFVITGFLLSSIIGFIMPNTCDDPQISRGEQLVNEILNTTARIIKKKYDITPCGEGASMPGGPIRKLTLCFDTKKPYTKEELRKLLVKCANELLDQVNTNTEIQTYLYEKPFTIRNIQIIIYNLDVNGREVCDPDISVGEISRDELMYQSVDPANTFRYKSQYRETYEEALQVIQMDSKGS